MEPGFSTGRGLGMGLPGAKRLMDEMSIQSEVGKGTTVQIRKWLKK
jgi:serine/threonine-protein kinase RsbT